jgi:hypothetical protein
MIRKTCLLFVVCWMSAAAHADMPTIDLGVGMYRIRAEVAHTQKTRMTGLMHRRNNGGRCRHAFRFSGGAGALHVDAQYAASAQRRIHRCKGRDHQHR